MTKVIPYMKGCAIYQQDMGDIGWVNESHEESCPITKKKWHTETVKVARETKI
jgi:hypothetical protein